MSVIFNSEGKIELNIGRSSRPQTFFKIGVFKIFANFTATLLKRDSNTDVLL